MLLKKYTNRHLKLFMIAIKRLQMNDISVLNNP